MVPFHMLFSVCKTKPKGTEMRPKRKCPMLAIFIFIPNLYISMDLFL